MTPKKVKPNTPKAGIIAHTHTLKTPNKQTHIAKESLTPTVKRIFSQTIHHNAFLSPIKKTPTRNVRSVIIEPNAIATDTQLLSPSLVQANTSQIQPSSSNHTQVEKSTHSATHTKTFNKTNSPNRLTSALTTRERKATNTHFKNSTHSITHTHKPTNTNKSHKNARYNPYARTLVQTQASRSNQKELASNTHTFTKNRVNDRSSITNTQNQTIASTSIERTQSQSQLKTSTQSNARETIEVTISNTVQQITHTERQTDLGQNFKPSAPNTKIITLNNKYVPKGVCFAIAVESNKKLSKNALKKITRNLASQM